MYRAQISAKNKLILFEALHAVGCHAHKVNSDANLRSKLQELGSLAQMQDPPLLRLENESYHLCLVLLQNSAVDRPLNGDVEVEAHLVQLCREVLEVYLKAAKGQPVVASTGAQPRTHWLIPVGSGKRRELAARAPVVVSTLHAISGLGDTLFRKNLALFFPLLSCLVSCEHGSTEVQVALSDMLNTWVDCPKNGASGSDMRDADLAAKSSRPRTPGLLTWPTRRDWSTGCTKDARCRTTDLAQVRSASPHLQAHASPPVRQAWREA
ncbi:hypothetical protein BHE74_00022912 [Ensete ventricosum]|nr:hypothetical protein BHE74_00022912 [Ensete ventricosum]